MAHNINTYVGRQAAWHELGIVTGHHMIWSEICSIPGMNFDVIKAQLADLNGNPVDAYGMFRSDNNVFLGSVGAGYTAMDHRSGFEIIDALMGSIDGAHYETAGVLGKGEKVWGLAALNQRIKIGGNDETNVYLLFSTSHDGSLSYNFRLVFERVVCQNTLGMALGEKTKASFTIRHTKNASNRVIEVHQTIARLGDDIHRMEDKLNFLAERKLNREALETIMLRLFPVKAKEDGTDSPATASTRRTNILVDVMKVYEINDGNTFPDQRGTAYNLLNAVTNYTDHLRSSRGGGDDADMVTKARSASAMFGSGDALKSKALDVIYEVAGSCDVVTRPQYFTSPVSVPATPFDVPVCTSGSSLLDSIVADIEARA